MDWLTMAEWGNRTASFFQFEYDFVINAVAASTLIGLVCGVVGTFIVLKGMALIGDAAGHATLPGVCVAFIIVQQKAMDALLIGALCSGLLAAWGVAYLSEQRRSRPDAAIGIVLSVSFGLGVVLLSYIQNSSSGAQAGLQDFLFGNAAGVSDFQLGVLSVVSVVLIAGIWLFYRPLVLTVFDRVFADSLGIDTRLIRYTLLIALTLAVVVSVQAVGVVLVSGMLIIPPSAALLLSTRISVVLFWSSIIGIVSAIAGSYFSFLFSGVATGPVMVLFAGFVFALALVFAPYGIFRRQLYGGSD